jgi:beta-glucosidase
VLLKFDTASAILGTGIRLGWQPPDDRLKEAVETARKADVAVVFAGEQLGEGYDKISLDLPGDQNRLIEAVAAANPHTVVVLHTSTAVAMPWIDKVAAVIEAWYPGQEAGSSIAALLFGDVNPSGKLPVTFPRDEKQGPATHWMEYPGNGRSVLYSEGVFVGYRWYDAHDQQPLFPFGHGLSYTSFDYTTIEVAGSGANRTLRVTLRNSGAREGAEVIQAYVGMPAAAEEPPQQLKAFDKVLLKPGESRMVTLPLGDELLRVYDDSQRQWRLIPGRYTIAVGASSKDIRRRAQFEITD